MLSTHHVYITELFILNNSMKVNILKCKYMSSLTKGPSCLPLA